jgi:hypothetical protein
MKVILKQKKIDTYDAYEVKGIDTLTDTPLVKQEIVEEDGQLILREHSIESNDVYKSEVKVDVYLNKGDLLIKSPQGYTKPTVQVIKVDGKLQKAIDLINQ